MYEKKKFVFIHKIIDFSRVCFILFYLFFNFILQPHEFYYLARKIKNVNYV